MPCATGLNAKRPASKVERTHTAFPARSGSIEASRKGISAGGKQWLNNKQHQLRLTGFKQAFIVETEGFLCPVRVQKWGNSLAVRIPKRFAKDAEVTEGTVLNLAVSEGKVVATPVERKLSLRELLSRVNKKNLHGETDFGRAVGREIW